MPDWTASMRQTFEYYTVDPGTWKDVKKLENVTSCTINRDAETDTLGSATFSMDEELNECYVRPYLITIQNGVTEKHPLGTFLVQSPSTNFDGKKKSTSMDAYTPLLELKENPPPLGYSILENENIMDNVYRLVREHARAPVIKTDCTEKLYGDFVSNTDDTWVTFISDLMNNAKYSFGLDELSRIIFLPKQDIASLQPVWTFDDGNSSILLPDLTLDRDLYDIPNTVEVVYSKGKDYYYAKVVNDDVNSPTSTVNRGREKLHRVINPSFAGDSTPTQHQIDEYAKQLLKELSTVTCRISYTHGYCPVRIGDCVRLDHVSANLRGITAKVISQSIKCQSGCTVSEKAVFTNKLWG